MGISAGSSCLEAPAAAPARLGPQGAGEVWRLIDPVPEIPDPTLDRRALSVRRDVRRGCRILVVDDDLSIRVSLSDLLADEGYVVETAANGQEALERIARQAPSLLLLDMRMPIMDGWELTRELRTRGIELPLVVMTAARDAQAWAEAVVAAAYAPKPFDYTALLATLDRLCGKPGRS